MSTKKLLKEFEQTQIEKINASREELRTIPDLKVGDSVKVKYKITEGTTTRLQPFIGVVIARSKDFSNYSATFTVRKISSGVGVERKFALYSPLLASIEVTKKGVVRRAKLYYLRNLTGKASRIKEKLDFLGAEASDNSAAEQKVVEQKNDEVKASE